SEPAEPALAPRDLTKWQTVLDHWDAFLVFVVKDLGALDDEQEARDALLLLLLDSRQDLLAVLAPGPQGMDPGAELFLRAWAPLRQAIRTVALRGRLRSSALRYMTFLAAADALAAVDGAGASLGIEISADGLRRLARILQPDYVGDPVAHTESPDSALRDMF